MDDGGCAGDAALDRLLDEDLCAHCEITTEPLEAEGVSVEVPGKTAFRPQARGEHHQGPWPQAEREKGHPVLPRSHRR